MNNNSLTVDFRMTLQIKFWKPGSRGRVKSKEVERNDPKIITSLWRSSGIHKCKVTSYTTKLKPLHEDETLTSLFCKTQFKAIENEISLVKKFDKINDVM